MLNLVMSQTTLKVLLAECFRLGNQNFSVTISTPFTPAITPTFQRLSLEVVFLSD
jgi:hypothetical protein